VRRLVQYCDRLAGGEVELVEDGVIDVADGAGFYEFEGGGGRFGEGEGVAE